MSKLRIWLQAARLRTLPLSVSGILFGAGLVATLQPLNWIYLLLCLLVTIGFQVTSNFANDYGDGVKGTDGGDRIGPARAIQTGALSPPQLLKGIYLSSLLSLALAILLLWKAFGPDELLKLSLFAALAVLSILGALKYTMGKNPYGYQGLGDIAVLLFFGLLAVWGTRYVMTQSWLADELLPAFAVGFLCMAVLNLNNLRDHQSDKVHGKNTLVVKNGFLWGKRYHLVLLFSAFVLLLLFLLGRGRGLDYLTLWPFAIIALHANRVRKTSDPAALDKELKVVALSTFFLSLTFFLLNTLFS